jgi:hypothetical protein
MQSFRLFLRFILMSNQTLLFLVEKPLLSGATESFLLTELLRF